MRRQILRIELICGCRSDMRATVGDLIAELIRNSPTNGIGDYLLNVGVEIGAAGLVTGLEVEHLARAAEEAAARSHYMSVLEPRAENERVGLRNIEGLAIKLLFLDEEMIGNTLCYGVRGEQIPHDLLLISAP